MDNVKILMHRMWRLFERQVDVALGYEPVGEDAIVSVEPIILRPMMPPPPPHAA